MPAAIFAKIDANIPTMRKMTAPIANRGTDAPAQAFWRRMGHLAMMPAASLALWLIVSANAASSQDLLSWSRSYINPFPGSDRYNVYVLGDSLAKGLAGGLQAAFSKGASVRITDQGVASSGLARPDRFDWGAKVDTLLKGEEFHVAIIMIGLNDRWSIRSASGYAKFGTEAWREAYGLRVDSLIKKLKAAKVAVYWVGLPITSDPKINAAIEVLNQVFREKTYVNGVKYIETWNGFVDQFGKYSAFGPDLTGRTKRLRDSNGIHFTSTGYRKLANLVEVVLERDLAAARRERHIPLAGDEAQQEQVARRAARETRKDGVQGEKSARDGATGQSKWRTDIAPGDKDKASTSKEATRAVPSNAADRAVALSGYAPPGELVAVDTGNGVTALATISPATTLSLQALRQQIPLTQRLYYRVLIRGEYVKPRGGRIDDFRWPNG